MSDEKPAIDEIYLAALELRDQEREIFLDQVCAGHPGIKERVQKLLKAHQQAGSLLEAPAPELHSPVIEINETAASDFNSPANNEKSASFAQTEPGRVAQGQGDHIGPYKLLEEIGEGGMGTVWVAQQSKPIKRRVAIKLIKAGMDSKSVLARFEAERQALAMMDHPNIARVLDGGMTDQGRPYFAMEYVKGVPLTEYCDQAKLSVKQRLELFLPICQAVQHAHQKGIIHRDLKPSNILICLYDGKPVPKVIDFGLAKAMHQSLTDQSLYTANGMMVGTPLYMSPEQAEQNNLDIDTRTDVYALGVILYELLTGSTPLEKEQMQQAAVNEIMRLIKEVEPPKPSTRLSGSASLPSVAAQRSIDPANLSRSVTGDLDWVVMKALEKERSRRYETANGLAEDIRRHLSDEPVSASPPSTRYRMHKFIKRNRGGVIAASAVAVALLMGVLGTTGGMFWAMAERKEAVAAREDAITNAELAKGEADRAMAAENQTAETLVEVAAERDAKELALKDAKDISEFLSAVFQSPDPQRDGREIKVAELLDTAAKKLETDLADQPTRRAKLQATLGKTYLSLGVYKQAIPLMEKARDYFLAKEGPEHLLTLAAMDTLASSYRLGGHLEKASQLSEEVLSRYRKVSGPNDPKTITAMHNLSHCYAETDLQDKALRMRKEVLTLRHKLNGAEHPHTLDAMGSLAVSYTDVGRLDKAQELLEEILPLSRKLFGPEHPSTISAMVQMAGFYHKVSRPDDGISLLEEVLPINREVYGPEHRRTLTVLYNLANFYRSAGRLDESLKLQKEMLPLMRRVLGPHPQTLAILSNLAKSNISAGRPDEVLKLQEEMLPIMREIHGPKHQYTLQAMIDLANSYISAGRLDEAIELQEDALPISRKVHGPKEPQTLSVLWNLTGSYRIAGRTDKAIELQEESLAIHREVFGPEHPNTLGVMTNLAMFYSNARHTPKAVSLQEQSLAIKRRVLPPNHPYFVNALSHMVKLYENSGRNKEALELRKELRDLAPSVPNQLALNQRLTEILAGESAIDAAELISLAQFADRKQRFTAAARCYSDAFKLSPELFNEKKTRHGYNAACYASLAAAGQTLDDPRPDKAAKTKLRQQALTWLDRELDRWTTLLASNDTPESRQTIVKRMKHWQADSDLAGIREEASLTQLPESDRIACEAVWIRVTKLLAQASTPPADDDNQ